MKTKLIVSLFALVVAAQLWVPASMILSSEKTLDSGKAFKFITAPVDPNDAFRGKHVILDFRAGDLHPEVQCEGAMSPGKKVYAILAQDSAGFAKVAGLTTRKPKEGYYVKGRLDRFSPVTKRIEFPFNRFFLEESKAVKAERLYREKNRRGKRDSYAIVKVGANGHAVIEDLILGGIPIMEALR
jgi:uncharacterized membrane-anchored protein